MNIYLITIGTLGLGVLGLIKMRKKEIKKRNEERSQERSQERSEVQDKVNNLYLYDLYENVKESFFLNGIYNILYVFSLCEIRYNKIIRYYNKYYNNKKVNNRTLTLLDKNASIITNISIDDKINPEWEYSGLILSDKINKVFYDKIPDIFNYNVSKNHFINIELEYNDKIYVMPLKSDNVNYYIVNNSLNSFFIKYYIKNILKLSVDENESIKYKIHIIDHNVNCFTITQEEVLKITEYGYVL